MYSSEDLERFYFQYQTESLPTGISIQDFCIKNKVPYNIFAKWYKDTRKKIVEVKVDGCPSGSAPVLPTLVTKEAAPIGSIAPPTRIWVELRMSGKFFTNIFNGCRDYSSLSPRNIGLALCQ